jgi:hypothetical protein
LEEVFDKAHFTEALESIFADLGPAQAMFGAASESPNVSALLNAAQTLVAFDMSFSTGIKVENTLSVFAEGSDASASLFFRLENLGVFAEATVDSVDLDIFPGVTVEGGNFLLSAGARIAAPFEGQIVMAGALAGSFTSTIPFSNALTTLPFEPYGQLSANLPFEATINDFTQTLTIKFEDDNVFDTQQLLVKVDFPVCPVVSVVDGLLGKLGSLGLSPKSIIGPVETAGLNLAETMDNYFPNLSEFIDGILEGMLLCNQLASFGGALLCCPVLSLFTIMRYILHTTSSHISPSHIIDHRSLPLPFILQRKMRSSISAPKLPRREMSALCWKMSSLCSWRMFWTLIASSLPKAAPQDGATEPFSKLKPTVQLLLIRRGDLHAITEADVLSVELILLHVDFVVLRQGPAISVSTTSLDLLVAVSCRMNALPCNCSMDSPSKEVTMAPKSSSSSNWTYRREA